MQRYIINRSIDRYMYMCVSICVCVCEWAGGVKLRLNNAVVCAVACGQLYWSCFNQRTHARTHADTCPSRKFFQNERNVTSRVAPDIYSILLCTVPTKYYTYCSVYAYMLRASLNRRIQKTGE